jgi:hypothetical protein
VVQAGLAAPDVPPDIKHNRIPAPGLSFEHPNMPQIVAEIEQLLLQPEAISQW